MRRESRIFVAGHRGLVGSALSRALRERGYNQLIERTSAEVDLRERDQVIRLFEETKPEFVFMAAARVGGILANANYPVDFLLDNLRIQNNVIGIAREAGVRKLLFLGSSCIYPKFADQPITEDSLLTGALEPTNQWYAIAKIAGLKLCEAMRIQHGFDAISAMPTNLYGPGDNYDLQSSHVLPALLRKCHEAKVNGIEEVAIWGTGTPRREFLHVDDLADAAIFLVNRYSAPEPVNVGWGEDISIEELASVIGRAVGFKGRFVFDPTRPDGTPRKLLDVSKLRALGWSARISLEAGIESTYRAYREQAQARLSSSGDRGD